MSRYIDQRLICHMLDQILKCFEHHSYGSIPGLCEEIRVSAQRMEDKLSVQKTFQEMRDDAKKVRAELEALEKQRDELKKEIEKLKESK